MIMVPNDAMAKLAAIYQPQGSLKVVLTPSGAVDAGAQWQVDGGAWQTNGTTVVLAAGTHGIGFASFNNWLSPSKITTAINLGQLTVLNAVYSPRFSSLLVTLTPTQAVSAGAQWQLDSGPWQTSGATLPVLPGNHLVSFKPAPGWNTPASRGLCSTNYLTNQISALYTLTESQPPTIAITSPSATNRPLYYYPMLTVAGTAQDAGGVDKVWYCLNQGKWTAANGTTNWTANVTLSPGTNTISVFAADRSGNTSATKSFSAVYGPGARLSLTVAGGGTVSPNLDGQTLLIGRSYTVTAKPDKGWMFSNWTGSQAAALPVLTFLMETNTAVQANFIRSSFQPFAGTYAGLFCDTNNLAPGSSGLMTVSIANSGAFTARIRSGANVISYAGQFTASGLCSNSIPRKNQPPLAVELQLAPAGDDLLTGRLNDSAWTAELVARRAVFSRTNVAPQTGKYTLIFPGSSAPAAPTIGNGFGSVIVDSSGNVRFSGCLADGSKVAQSAPVGRAGEWPLYVTLSGGACLIGTVAFTPSPDADLDGLVYWIKPAQPTAKFYAEGFTNSVEAVGSRFGFTKGTPILGANPAQLVLLDGSLPVGLTNDIVIQSNSTVINFSSNKLNLGFTPSSGWFNGKVLNPITGQMIPVSGAVLQKQNTGCGFFLGTNRSGSVMLKTQTWPGSR
jgi:hypothetical protein